jgi:RNA polymerase sigma-70 factor (ECF subfamily)
MPPSPHADDATLIDRVGRGDVDAVAAMFAAYAPYLRAIVRCRMADRLQSKFDSADVVQSVWVQVLRQIGRPGWQIADERQLRALLATIARRRLITRIRRTDDADPGPDEVDELPQVGQARPSEVVQADDVWDKLLDLCPADHHPVLALRREGVSLTEIAARTGLHEGSVRRIIRRLASALALQEEPIIDDPAAADSGEPGEPGA